MRLGHVAHDRIDQLRYRLYVRGLGIGEFEPSFFCMVRRSSTLRVVTDDDPVQVIEMSCRGSSF